MGRGNELFPGIALFILILALMWNLTVRHEAAIRSLWIKFLQHPLIVAWRLSLAPQEAFMRARLSPHGYAGLQMTAGALVLVGASWLFGGISEDVMTGDPLTVVDLAVAAWFYAHATPLMTEGMRAVSNVHGVAAISAYVALLVLYLLWKRDWVWAWCVGAIVPGGMLLNVLMKHAFQRARPDVDHALQAVSTYSFPSGHVAGAALFYGVLAAMLVSKIDVWRWRVLIVFLAIALVVLVALSRMYLGVHYLSDVLAAFAEAAAWLSLCLTGIHAWWQHRADGAAK